MFDTKIAEFLFQEELSDLRTVIDPALLFALETMQIANKFPFHAERNFISRVHDGNVSR